MRSSDEYSVRPSARPPVGPSNKRADCDKTEERSVQIFIPYELKRKMVGEGDTFYLKFWVNRPLLERNRRF